MSWERDARLRRSLPVTLISELKDAYRVAAAVRAQRETRGRATGRTQDRFHKPDDLGRIQRPCADVGYVLRPHAP